MDWYKSFIKNGNKYYPITDYFNCVIGNDNKNRAKSIMDFLKIQYPNREFIIIKRYLSAWYYTNKYHYQVYYRNIQN